LRNNLILIFCFFTGFLLISCVTTTENKVDTVNSSDNSQEQTSEAVKNSTVSKSNSGVIYNSRVLSEGPLLLGSKEYLSGPVAEFSILYTIYFPLSGILIPDHDYSVSFGTRWQVESDKLVQDVFFERALLSEDDEGKSWWYFKVEGDGFEREYEFLIDADWKLIEMRFFMDGQFNSYIPSIDELNNLSNGSIVYADFKTGKENVQIPYGSYNADHIVFESSEHWMSSKVTGAFVKSVLKEDDEIILSASVIEEKEGYETILESY